MLSATCTRLPREQHRPLFVTMLLYLNESWPEDWHSETMFLDPETQLGLFVRPAPGRWARARAAVQSPVPHRGESLTPGSTPAAAGRM